MKKLHTLFKYTSLFLWISLPSMVLANQEQEDIPWDQLSVSIRIQAYVNAISYEQTDLLCYSYGKLISDLRSYEYLMREFQFTGKYSPHYSENAHFNRHFFSDAQFRRSIREWLFLHSDALNQAIQNNELGSEEQKALQERQSARSLWDKTKSLVFGSEEVNTHSFWSRYTQYAKYLVESNGFNEAIKHCANRNGLDKDELKEVMAEAILSHNRNAGLGIGVVGLGILAYTGWHAGVYLLKGLASLGRGMMWLWHLRHRLYHQPTVLNLRGTPQISSAQQQVVRSEMQKVTQQTNSFRDFVSNPSKATFPTGSVAEVAVESGFVFILSNQMADNMSNNQNLLPQKTEKTSLGEINDTNEKIQETEDQINLDWWASRLIDYEALISEWLILSRLEETQPDQPETIKAKRDFNTFLDYYLTDYWIIQSRVDQYRERIVDLEKQIHELCPGQSVRGRVRCRDRKREQVQELERKLFEEKHKTTYRISRTVLPLLSFRKSHLDKIFEDRNPDLHHRLIFDLMALNRDREHGLCSVSIGFNEYKDALYPSPFCHFIFLYTRARIINLEGEQATQLEELYRTLE